MKNVLNWPKAKFIQHSSLTVRLNFALRGMTSNEKYFFLSSNHEWLQEESGFIFLPENKVKIMTPFMSYLWHFLIQKDDSKLMNNMIFNPRKCHATLASSFLSERICEGNKLHMNIKFSTTHWTLILFVYKLLSFLSMNSFFNFHSHLHIPSLPAI